MSGAAGGMVQVRVTVLINYLCSKAQPGQYLKALSLSQGDA